MPPAMGILPYPSRKEKKNALKILSVSREAMQNVMALLLLLFGKCEKEDDFQTLCVL